MEQKKLKAIEDSTAPGMEEYFPDTILISDLALKNNTSKVLNEQPTDLFHSKLLSKQTQLSHLLPRNVSKRPLEHEQKNL